jgi:hypothetical protein
MSAHFQSVSTARLRLRRVLPVDLEAVLAIQTDPQTNLHNPAPFTADQTRRLDALDRGEPARE